MIDREQWMRENRFKNMARLLTEEAMQLPRMPQDDPELANELAEFLADKLYSNIIPHVLAAVLPRIQEVMRQQVEFGGDIYVDVPDITHWPDPPS